MKKLLLTLAVVLVSVTAVYADVPALTPAEEAWITFRTYLPYVLIFASFLILIVVAWFVNRKRNGK